jgi:hypothetical protein
MRKTLGSTGLVILLMATLGVGSAVGAALITSADIKNKTIKQKDMARGAVNSRVIKDRSVRQQDLAFDAVTTQIIGPGAVTEAQLSPAVQDVVSRFTVPSGSTIRGAIGGDFDSPSGGNDWGVIANLPLKARNDLTDADVHVNVSTWTNAGGQTPPTTTDGNVGCTGTIANPTAPAGDVCIYVAGGDNAADLFGFSIVPGTGGSPYGFKLNFTSPIGGDTYIDAVWAYTAP